MNDTECRRILREKRLAKMTPEQIEAEKAKLKAYQKAYRELSKKKKEIA